MVSDPSAVAPTAPQVATCGVKVRVRFRKGGDLRLVSHHDLMHCFERMLRRAALPVHATQGFHPKPRVIFAQSLALGILGCEEVVELELDEALSADEVFERLAGQAPPGLDILSVRAIPRKAKAQVRRAGYRVNLPAERAADVPARIAELLAAPHAWVERTRPQPRRLDLRPYVSELRLEGAVLEMMLWVTPVGAARPDEILHLLGLSDVVEQGAVIERALLELHDEVTPEAQAATAPGEPHPQELTQQAEGRKDSQPARADQPSRPTALFPGPLSFDS